MLIEEFSMSEVGRWSHEKAKQWYDDQPWLVGCNFIPSIAVNQLEMWQADTFEPEKSDRELGWAADIGFNTVRTYLHDLVWKADSKGFKNRIDRFLTIADRHGIRPMFVIFDDCWNPNPQIGKQPAPKQGVHNSGWMKSPGKKVAKEPAQWGRLEKYVTDIIASFAKDDRILMWDLYNEPGWNGMKSFALVKSVVKWARDVDPSQPMTIGVHNFAPRYKVYNEFQLANSDIITFHHYGKSKSLQHLIDKLKAHNRPMICTEWLARTEGSLVDLNLPVFKQNDVGCINWGLVAGKTNTIHPWLLTSAGIKNWLLNRLGIFNEPKPWFHDLFRSDGTPFDREEINLFKELRDQAESSKLSINLTKEI